jgi:hypothetical protein
VVSIKGEWVGKSIGPRKELDSSKEASETGTHIPSSQDIAVRYSVKLGRRLGQSFSQARTQKNGENDLLPFREFYRLISFWSDALLLQ